MMCSATVNTFTIVFDTYVTEDVLSVKAEVPSVVETNRTDEKLQRMSRSLMNMNHEA